MNERAPDSQRRNPDQAREADLEGKTSPKFADESMSEAEQAPRYEPRFRSFSGHHAEHALPSIRARGSSVTEFGLEDKERGVIYTAHGERPVEPSHQPRESFITGLRKAISSAGTREESEQAQASFSIQYILQKVQSLINFGKKTDTELGANEAEQVPNLESSNLAAGSEDSSPHTIMRTEYSDSDKGTIIEPERAPDLIADKPNDEGTSWLSPEQKAWLQDTAKKLKELKDQVYEEIGSPRTVKSTPESVLACYREMLNSPKRDLGEYHMSIARKGSELCVSPMVFTRALGTVGGADPNRGLAGFYDPKPYELHLSLDTQRFPDGYKVETLMHSHPKTSNKALDPFSFDGVDKSQADWYQQRTETTVRSFLLTPDNKLLVYVPRDAKNHPNGEEVGQFEANGLFKVTNEKYRKEFSPYVQPNAP